MFGLSCCSVERPLCCHISFCTLSECVESHTDCYVCCLLPLTLLCRIRYQISKRYVYIVAKWKKHTHKQNIHTHVQAHSQLLQTVLLVRFVICAKHSSIDFVYQMLSLNYRFFTYVFRSFVRRMHSVMKSAFLIFSTNETRNDQMCAVSMPNAYSTSETTCLNMRCWCWCFCCCMCDRVVEMDF